MEKLNKQETMEELITTLIELDEETYGEALKELDKMIERKPRLFGFAINTIAYVETQRKQRKILKS